MLASDHHPYDQRLGNKPSSMFMRLIAEPEHALNGVVALHDSLILRKIRVARSGPTAAWAIGRRSSSSAPGNRPRRSQATLPFRLDRFRGHVSSTMLYVAELANLDFLLEVDAVAVVPLEA
jgi:hypothetical protein